MSAKLEPLFDAELREWFVISFVFEESLVGRIYEDQKGRWPDGRWIVTSAIKNRRHRVKSGNIVRTANSRYLLVGEPYNVH